MFILKAESIHLEIGLFLQKLKSYLAKSKNQQNHALTAVSLLLSDYEEHTFQNPEKTDIRFFLQDANIEIKRNAFCRRCDVSIMRNYKIVYIHATINKKWHHC